jgi:hypothetical protein
LPAAFECRVTEGFLESGQTISQAANVAALIAGLGCWWMKGAGLAFLFVSLMAWALETWFAVRVSIDRSLFHTMAERPEDAGEALDAVLVDWRIIKQARPRSMADRCRGALRLVRKQTLAFGVQLIMLLCTALLAMVDI